MLDALATALYSQLTGGTALTALLAGTTSVYHLQAPEDASLPYVVYSVQAGGDTNQSPNRDKNLLIYVRCFAASGALEAGQLDAQIDQRLHMQNMPVTGWTNVWLARETDMESAETLTNGSIIYSAGGMYRLRLDQA